MSELQFIEEINKAYDFKGPSVYLGGAQLNGKVLAEAEVKIPLKMMNRHGLIAGATGTGKTKSLQILAEQISAEGVCSLLIDIKGDLSGIAMPGEPSSGLEARMNTLNKEWFASGNFVEFLSISGNTGTQMRATVSEFGPVLFSKILGLNETQESVLAMIFKFCDDEGLLLIDLVDLKRVIQFISAEGKDLISKEFGNFSPASSGTILRKIIELEQQGASVFFGERSFDVQDLVRHDKNGRGVISILRVQDIQQYPKFFSTFLLQILSEVYHSFPEVGDLDKPKLVLFFDEAHLLFNEANKALLQQIETAVKLIRSKGIGLFFCTQNPVDIPEEVLAQLGLKIQHALRAFTAKDRKAINLAAQNYPESKYYEVADHITQLGIGEAFITSLDEKGIPTPLVHTVLRAPQSRMGLLLEEELKNIVSQSAIAEYYNELIDRESAAEILNKKFEMIPDEMQQKGEQENRNLHGPLKKILDSTMARQVARTVFRELTRGLMGSLGLNKRRSGKSWF